MVLSSNLVSPSLKKNFPWNTYNPQPYDMNSTCMLHDDDTTLPHYQCVRPNDVAFLNVLSEGMPECDRKNDPMMNWKDDDTKKDVCYVYCAQKTCHAAKNFMESHDEELRSRCGTVVYLPEGALGMHPSELVDGELCHANIAKHNLGKGVQGGCLTCEEAGGSGSEEEGTSVRVTVDDTPVHATYFETKREVPEWFQRSGIVGLLPPPFSCDPRYKESPVPHAPSSLSSMAKVRMDISETGLPRDAVLGYWAAHGGKGDDILVAEKAYGSFENSGIVQCVDAMCEFDLVPPKRYTTEGKVFKSHFHFTEWLGNRWNLDAKTVDIE